MATPLTATRVIGYCRVSTDQQSDEGISLDAQAVRIAAFVASQGFELVELVQETGSARTLSRPELRRVLQRLERGEADAIVVAKLDRLTRSVRDLGTLLDGPFAARGQGAPIGLISVAESLDTRTAVGLFFLHLLGSIAQWERDRIAENTTDALRHLKARGVHIGGFPYGLQLGDRLPGGGRALVGNPKELEALRLLLQARAQGMPVAKVAQFLNERGHRLRSGRPWTQNAVVRAVKNAPKVAKHTDLRIPPAAVSKATRKLAEAQARALDPAVLVIDPRQTALFGAGAAR